MTSYNHFKCRAEHIINVSNIILLAAEHGLNIYKPIIKPYANLDMDVEWEFKSINSYDEWMLFFLKVETLHDHLECIYIVYETFQTIDNYTGEREDIDFIKQKYNLLEE